jgi:hypothetical protein
MMLKSCFLVVLTTARLIFLQVTDVDSLNFRFVPRNPSKFPRTHGNVGTRPNGQGRRWGVNFVSTKRVEIALFHSTWSITNMNVPLVN